MAYLYLVFTLESPCNYCFVTIAKPTILYNNKKTFLFVVRNILEVKHLLLHFYLKFKDSCHQTRAGVEPQHLLAVELLFL